MLEKYYRINQAVGISIYLFPDGSAEINCCQVHIENNNLTFEKKITGLREIGELNEHFPGSSLMAVNFSGKGVLTKQLARVDEITQNNFNQVLPNANIDDFYIQNFISGDQSFVSAIRKVEADKWIDQLRAKGFKPLMFSLGLFPVQNIIPQLNIYDNELLFNGHHIIRKENEEWVSYKFDSKIKSPFPIKVESESLDEKLIVSYGAVFQLLMSSKIPLIQANVTGLEDELNSVTQYQKLRFVGMLILAVFFILLLINFMCFSRLNTMNAQLAEQVSKTSQSTTDIQTLKEQVKQKEVLLRELGWDNGSNKSVFVDQLASLLPGEVTLTEISVNPIDQAGSRIQKSLLFFNRQINVTGISENIIPVNEWIARIKTRDWVKNVQLDSYIYNNEINSGQFTIVINY